MLNITYRPIERWPRPLTHPTLRRWGPFKAGFNSTLKLLETELRHLDAKNAVLQLALRETDFRRDGLPYANAKPNHPGVILSFDSKHGPLSLPCDEMREWQHNLRAITMHLHHLRLSSLYGVGRYGEPYRGWARLPASTSASAGVSDAADFLARIVAQDGTTVETLRRSILEGENTFQAAYRTAARKLHPDAGGDHNAFVRLQDAAKLLRLHHGG